jgi:hypothetical protein
MLKLGLMHAMLLDHPGGSAHKRRPRVSGELLKVLAPYDFGRGMIELLKRMGILDDAQRDWLGRRR